jgi:hypothetical protein
MKAMTYFTAPSALAYALLLAGVAISIVSLATMVSPASRPGSPAAPIDRISYRVGACVGTALLVAGGAPLLWAPVMSALGSR